MRFPQCLKCDAYTMTDKYGYCQDCYYLDLDNQCEGWEQDELFSRSEEEYV